MRKRRARALSALAASILAAPFGANAAGPGELDALSLPAPTSPTRFASLESSGALGHRSYSSGARLSYIKSPLELTTPSASPGGTTSPALAHLLAAEVLLAGGFGASFDAGISLPMRFYQEGAGLDAIGQSARVASPALSDPRLFVAYATEPAELLRLRPYASIYLPLATRNAFAGGGAARGVLGASTSYGDASLITLDVSTLLAETITMGLSQWGSVARLGLGYSAPLLDAASLSVEGTLAVPLVGQLSPPGGVSPLYLSTELLVTFRQRFGNHHLGVLAGAGLPTGHSSSLSNQEAVRAPTTPSLRLALEYRFEQSPNRAKPLDLGF
jgi:hypothetical protein